MAHFDLIVSPELGRSDSVMAAIRTFCERDYNTIAGVFPPFLPQPSNKITVYAHVRCNLPKTPETVGVATRESDSVFHCVAPGKRPPPTAAIRTMCASVAGLVVQCCGASTLSWTSQSSLGQGLCLAIVRELYPDAVAVFETAERSWLGASPLTDYVNKPASDAGRPAANGCVMLFLSYLHDMGFGWHQIVLAGLPLDSTPRDIYHILTGDDADPFPVFRRLVDEELRTSRDDRHTAHI